MKIIGTILIFINFFIYSEDPILPKNDAGVVHFEEVVKVENLGKEALFTNALKFASTVKKQNKKKSDVAADFSSGVIHKSGSFFVYTQGLLTPQIHGEISFDVKLEILDSGYKYVFSNFVFNYYQRNRHGQYKPVSGKKKPLEEEKFAGMQKTWIEHKKTTRGFIDNQIQFLKSKMEETPEGANIAKEKPERVRN